MTDELIMLEIPEERQKYINSKNQEKDKQKYIDHKNQEEIKPNKYAASILVFKSVITMPFYLVAIYEPFYIQEYAWLLYMEAFHHFHARIFFLLAVYRNILQLYFGLFSNGFYQRRFIMMEVIFDFGVLGLYLHENFGLHNIQLFYSSFFSFYVINALLSIYSLFVTNTMKFEHIV
jgi:hypothetical protein